MPPELLAMAGQVLGGMSGGAGAVSQPLQSGQIQFGSVNFKSPGAGNSYPSAAGIPAVSAPDYGFGSAGSTGLNPWVLGGLALAAGLALLFILKKK